MAGVTVRRYGPTKSFEITIPFTRIHGERYPLVPVSFWTIYNDWLTVPLIFDTGAEPIILKPEYRRLFPPGRQELVGGVGEEQGHTVMATKANVEFLGRIQSCEIVIDKVPKDFAAGIFGRDGFKPYGFGFWETARELYVTLKP
jgi:hypothetical protein